MRFSSTYRNDRSLWAGTAISKAPWTALVFQGPPSRLAVRSAFVHTSAAEPKSPAQSPAHDVAFTVGGNYYQGNAHSKLAVYDPKAGNVDGNGKLPHNGVTAAANVHGEYDDDGLQGHVKYSEDRTTGDVKLESTSLSSMSVVGNAVVILGKAKLNGVANYTFQAIVIDNGEPGTKDLFGLKVFDPTGAAVASLTFSPVNLTGGNFEVQHGDD